MCSQGRASFRIAIRNTTCAPSLTLVRGRHLLHFGFQFEVRLPTMPPKPMWPAEPSTSALLASRALPGLSIADFLLGYADNFSNVNNHYFAQAVVPAFTAGKQGLSGSLLQRYVAPQRSTFNESAVSDTNCKETWSERHNRLTYFDPGANSYINQFMSGAHSTVMGDVFLVSPAERTIYPSPEITWGRRVGIAYSLSPTTVMRSGYGIFWIPDYVSYALKSK